MTTCLCGIFDPATGTLEYTNAGHPPPLVRRAGGRRGTARGRAQRCRSACSAGCGARRRGRSWRPATRCCVYTDGLVERRTEVIDVGIDRLAARFAGAGDDPEAICAVIVGAIEQGLEDDVALLALVRG